MDRDCEFCQIVRGDRQARIVGDASDVLAFFPLRPVCLGHTLVIPKTHVRDLWAAGSRLDTELMQAVIRVGQAIKAIFGQMAEPGQLRGRSGVANSLPPASARRSPLGG